MTRARDVANRTVKNGSVDTAQLVADAVDNTILDLTDDFAFTGTISGAGGGKVLQLVHSSVTARESLTCTANVYVDTNLTLNITPSATTSKILVLANLVHGNTGANYPTYVRVARTLSSTQTALTTKLQHFGYVANGENNTGSANCSALDDPQTTNQLTYTAQITRVTNGTAHFNGNYYQTGFESFLTAIEIGA